MANCSKESPIAPTTVAFHLPVVDDDLPLIMERLDLNEGAEPNSPADMGTPTNTPIAASSKAETPADVSAAPTPTIAADKPPMTITEIFKTLFSTDANNKVNGCGKSANGDVKKAKCCEEKADCADEKPACDETMVICCDETELACEKAACGKAKASCDESKTECCECCEEKADVDKIDANGEKVNGNDNIEATNGTAKVANGESIACKFLTDALKAPALSVDQLYAENSASVVQIKSDRKMRVFLVQTAQGLSPSSGGFKANYCFLVQLAKSGHDCAQLCYAFESEIKRAVADLKAKGKDAQVKQERVHVTDKHNRLQVFDVTLFYNDDGILNIALDRRVFNVVWPTNLFFPGIIEFLEYGTYDEEGDVDGVSPAMRTLINLFSEHISRFEPTHIVFNDALTMKIAANHPLRPWIKRIGIIHTAEQLPFGPFSQGILGHCMSPKFEVGMLHDLDGIWSVSKSIQEYSKKYGNLDTKFLVHSPLTYLDSNRQMPLVRDNIDKVAVGMVNPCPHKGMDILVALAKELPHIKFVTWASWGSGDEHLEILNSIPNIEVMPTTRNTDEIWDTIKILIAPSVWHEAWGIIVTEAQLRGIPVVASNAGGLPEAKIGLPYVIPVNMVTGKRHPNGYYVVPKQDIASWKKVVGGLMTCRDEYAKVAAMTAEVSAKWLRSLDPLAHEKWLLSMMDEEEDVEIGF